MTSPHQSSNGDSPWDKAPDERWRIEALLTQSESNCLPSSAAQPSSTPWQPSQTHPAARLASPASESTRMRQQVKTLFRQFQQDVCQETAVSSAAAPTDWRNTHNGNSPNAYANENEPFFTDLFTSAFTQHSNTQLEQALTPVLHASMAAALTPNVVETSGTSLLGAPSSIWSPQSSSSRNGSPYDAPKSLARSPRASTPTSDSRSPARSKKAPAKGWWKTEICKFWREGGGCRNEANCRWAHGLHELRRLETPETVAQPVLSPSASLHPAPCWTPTDSPTRTRPASPPAQLTEDDTQQLNKWLSCPPSILYPDYRPAALQSLWDLIRQTHDNLDENLRDLHLLVAGPPGLEINAQYWQRILAIFSNQSPNDHNACNLCTARMAPGSPMMTESLGSGCCSAAEEAWSVRCCDNCNVIVGEKCTGLNWNPISIMRMMNEPSDDNTKLTQWAFRFANLLRSIDDGSWTSEEEPVNLLEVDPLVDRWAQHERHVARASLMVKRSMEKLTSSRRLRLITMEVMPGISLAEWMAMAGQPALFIALLGSSFAVHRRSMPAKLISLSTSLRSASKEPQRMILTSISSSPKSGASPSALSTGINSPTLSEEALTAPMAYGNNADSEMYLDTRHHPPTSSVITTTGDSTAGCVSGKMGGEEAHAAPPSDASS